MPGPRTTWNGFEFETGPKPSTAPGRRFGVGDLVQCINLTVGPAELEPGHIYKVVLTDHYTSQGYTVRVESLAGNQIHAELSEDHFILIQKGEPVPTIDTKPGSISGVTKTDTLFAPSSVVTSLQEDIRKLQETVAKLTATVQSKTQEPVEDEDPNYFEVEDRDGDSVSFSFQPHADYPFEIEAPCLVLLNRDQVGQIVDRLQVWLDEPTSRGMGSPGCLLDSE